jgi:ABC-type branched-subunit amino acid transport system permease subunit
MIEYLVTVLTLVALFGIQALGLNIQWGWAGLLNLSFVGWTALGAYVTAFLTSGPPTSYEQHWLGFHLPFIVGLGGAMLVAGVLSLVLGWVALKRLRSDYFAIVTLVVYEIFYTWAATYVPFANGATGLVDIPQPFVDVVPFDYYNYFILGLSVLVLACIFVFCSVLQRSSFGRALRAVRDDQTAAMAFGRSALWFKLRAFVLGSVIAAIGGSLTAAWSGSWAPSSWTAPETLLLLSAIMLGGTANNFGVILGTVIVTGIFNFVVAYVPDLPVGGPQLLQNLRFVIYGVLVVAVLLWRPQGVIPEPLGRDPDEVSVSPGTGQAVPA